MYARLSLVIKKLVHAGSDQKFTGLTNVDFMLNFAQDTNSNQDQPHTCRKQLEEFLAYTVK